MAQRYVHNTHDGAAVATSVHYGVRGERFTEFIRGLLAMGRVGQRCITILTSEESLRLYEQAFTTAAADQEVNLENYEQLGDLAANKFIVGYMYRRFPQLFCPLGVKVVARLRINYGSKDWFSKIADDLGFWPYITALTVQRQSQKKSLLEDVFEAFFGVTEYIIDIKTRSGCGYPIVYDIMSTVFDKIDVSLRYEDLYDAKTRLKETFDMFGSQLGVFKFTESHGAQGMHSKITTSTLWQTSPDGKRVRIGEGQAHIKADAQQLASQAGLETLRKAGFVRKPPREYKRFNAGERQSKEVEVAAWISGTRRCHVVLADLFRLPMDTEGRFLVLDADGLRQECSKHFERDQAHPPRDFFDQVGGLRRAFVKTVTGESVAGQWDVGEGMSVELGGEWHSLDAAGKVPESGGAMAGCIVSELDPDTRVGFAGCPMMPEAHIDRFPLVYWDDAAQ